MLKKLKRGLEDFVHMHVITKFKQELMFNQYSPAERGQKVEVEYVQTFIAVS